MTSPPTTPTELFLVAAPGTEALVADEARAALVDAQIERVDGGVTLVGSRELVMRANLLLGLPTRVLVRLGVIEARDFGRMRRGVTKLPLLSWLPRGTKISLRATATKSRLFHTGAIVQHVSEALGEAFGFVTDASDDAHALVVRGVHDVFTVSLDTSGALLHRRGWRTLGGEAPLRETLAAALLVLAAHRDDEPLCDPMCGSGTIAIEAALRARHRAPGLGRTFAFERFVEHDAVAWRALQDRARASEHDGPLIVAADADAAQLELARANASAAGVQLELEHTPIQRLQPRAQRGLILTNPPYGKRIASKGALIVLRRALRGPFAAWRAGILLPDRNELDKLGLTTGEALSNGGLRVWLGLR